MKTILKKTSGILLAVCMLATMFTCLAGMGASASSSDTQMLHAKATATGLKFGWRSDSGSPIAKGTKYRLSLDWENVSNIPFGSSTFGIYCYVGSWKNIFNNITYVDEWNVSSYALAHGDHYNIDFTVKSSLSAECREFVVYFGDINNGISSYELNTANWILYTRDDSNNLTDTGKTFTFPVTFRGASDGAMNSYINSYTASDRGQLWANNTSSSYVRSFVDIPSGYFDRTELPSDLVTFNGTDTYARFLYTKGWSTIVAGNYKFTMDCKILSGTPTIKIGNAGDSWNKYDEQTDYEVIYDNINYKYTITFTLTSNVTGNIGAMIGNYGTDGNFACANPELYLLNGSGDPTGENLFNTFNSVNYGTSANQWDRRSSGYTCEEIPSGYFDPYVEPVHEYVHFEPNRNNYSRFNYCFAPGSLTAGDYRFQMDCKIFSGTPRITVGNRDEGDNTFSPFSTQTNYTATYDAENYKYTITFTLTTDLASGEYMCILVGNYGDDGDFVCANPTFYKMSGGDPTGSNLINTFASEFYSSSMAVGKWERRGNYTCTELPEHYFDKESTGNYALHFPQVSDSYQVVVYKDTGIYVAADSKYRLVMDVNNLTEAEPTVQMLVNSDIGTSYTGTLISTNGFERVYEFTVTSSATGIGLFMGPYGNGSNIDVAFRKPRLYKWVNDTYGGANMLAPLSAANFDRNNWSASRATAANGKWTPLNCNGTLLQYDVDDGSNFVEVKEQMVHFPIGYDNYHVLAYKGGEIPAGTYRFTVDEYAVTGVTSYVNLFVNSGYTTAVTKDSDTLSGTKRTVEFTLYNAKDSFLLMIGNYGKGDNMDTYYENAKLYKVEGGSTVGSNLISTFKNTNVVFTTSGSRTNAATNKWTTINWAKGYIIFDEYNPNPRMLKLGGFGESMNALSYELALTPGETYQFDMDYRANGGVSARKAVSAKVSGDETESLTNSNTISRTDTGTHYSARFTISSGATAGKNNFNIYIGQSWPQKRNGTVYFANLTLRKVTGGTLGKANYFYNGDFHRGDTGVVTNSTKNNVFDGWDQKKVMTYSRVEIMDTPEGFFTDDPDMRLDKAYEFKGGDLYKPQFNFQFSSNRKYRLMYDYSCAADDTVNTYIISKNNAITATKVRNKSANRFEAVYDIEVGANADPYNDSNCPNGSIRFALNGNSYDSPFSIANIRMYYLDSDDNITGANLVYNLNPVLQDGYYGLSDVGDTSTFTLSTDDSNVESQKRNVGISWVGNLNYVNENVGCYSRVVKTNGHRFDNYNKTKSIEYMRQALLGTGEGYNPCADAMSRFYDINSDTGSDVADLVRFKKNAVGSIDAFAVENEQTNGGIYDSFNKVVCYGDSITQGMGYTAAEAYPGRLQSMIGSGYTVLNSGDAGETSETIMARQGALSLKTSKAFTFPAGTATITVGDQDDNGFVSLNGDNIGLTGALGNEISLNNITIDGKEYTISLSDFVWSPRSYTVKLTRVGGTANAITIPAGTKTVFQNTTSQDTCEIYLVGANDSDKSTDLLVAKYKAMVDKHGSNNFLIIIPYFGGVSATPFLNAFGDHCVDIKTIASTDEAFEYEGLTKTALDESMISQNRFPTSFRRVADENEVHLNDKGYDLLAHHLYLQGKALSYFDSPALRTVNQRYKYEIHMHDKEVSKCGQSAGLSYIDKAKREGFAGFVITNHFYRGNTAIDRSLAWADFVDAYRQDYETLKAEAAKQDMDVLFGIEDDYDSSHHLLIYGITPDQLDTIPQYPSMTLSELYNFVHSNGGIIVFAHPFQNTSDENLSGYPDMRYADAIEVYNAGISDESNRLAREYAEAHNLRMTAGSDAHNITSFGGGVMEFTHRLYNSENLVAEILAGNYSLITG